MPVEHDLIQHLHNLQLSLRRDKMPLGLFLGAGCPSAIIINEKRPLIPDIAGLTQLCVESAKHDKGCKGAMGNLLAKLDADGFTTPNIERILTEIRGLLQVVGKAEFCGLGADDLKRLESCLCDHIVDVTSQALPHNETPYHKLAAWIGAIPRSEPVEIFTSNYDLLMEQALEETQVPFFDGFLGSCDAFFDPHAIDNDSLPPRWARLWKLHGSINWYMHEDGTVFRTSRTTDHDCRLIHPSHLKYEESRTMPYFAMIDRLRRFLTQPFSLLAICGYSFRDEHLNAAIVDALERNPTGVAFGILLGKLDTYENAVGLAQRTSNLVLLADDAGVVGRTGGSWVRDQPDDSELWEYTVRWVEHTPTLKLGDFDAFGTFLSEVVAGA